MRCPDIRQLADLATRCRAYAKALHYKELDPRLEPRRQARRAEQLIAINRKLAQPEAALGVARYERGRRGRRTRHVNPNSDQVEDDDEALDQTPPPRLSNESWLQISSMTKPY